VYFVQLGVYDTLLRDKRKLSAVSLCAFSFVRRFDEVDGFATGLT
jgi:hypothetical protein